jgi:hypothetical protein
MDVSLSRGFQRLVGKLELEELLVIELVIVAGVHGVAPLSLSALGYVRCK